MMIHCSAHGTSRLARKWGTSLRTEGITTILVHPGAFDDLRTNLPINAVLIYVRMGRHGHGQLNQRLDVGILSAGQADLAFGVCNWMPAGSERCEAGGRGGLLRLGRRATSLVTVCVVLCDVSKHAQAIRLCIDASRAEL